MKKHFYTLSLIFLTFSFSNIKAQAFEEGRSIVSVGYGVAGLSGTFFRDFFDGTDIVSKNFGPIYFKYEYAVSEKLGIGVAVANVSNSYSTTGSYIDNNGISRNYTEKLSRSNTSILARLNWHFGEDDNFDPYFGFGMGYRFGGWEYTISDPAAGDNETVPAVIPFGFELTTGARYFFTDNFGIYGEVGLAKSIGQFGLSVKF
jgi:opacity protein-like surface antigen